MKFVYEYRTSDNALHHGSVAAADRDAAFAALKARGVRPARLVEAPGFLNKLFGKGKRWIAIAVLSVAAAAGWYFAAPSGDGGERDFSGWTSEERGAFKALTAQADEVLDRAEKSRAAAGMEKLDDYALIFVTPDVSAFYTLVDRERQIVNESRRSLKRIFDGRRMAELDAAEISLKNRRMALALLDGNRGKWRVEAGWPVFDDSRTRRMFEYCLEGIRTDAATSRWHQDFSE